MNLHTRKSTILLVDDEPSMIEAYKELLKDDYNLVSAYNGRDALTKLEQTNIDLVILDILLPDLNGVSILKEIKRKFDSVNVIMVSALNKARPAASSMKLGAYEYLTKPFDINEFTHKIRELLTNKPYTNKQPDEVIRCGGILINLSQRTVWRGKSQVCLSHKEYEVLQLFVRNPGRILRRAHLWEIIWNTQYDQINQRTMDTHIYSLRKKLGTTGRRIVTIVSEGYKFDDN